MKGDRKQKRKRPAARFGREFTPVGQAQTESLQRGICKQGVGYAEKVFWGLKAGGEGGKMAVLAGKGFSKLLAWRAD